MNGRIADLQRAFVYFSAACINMNVFTFAVLCAHSAKWSKAQATVRLDLRHHSAESVGMRFKKQRVFGVLSAQIDEHAALLREHGRKPQLLKLIFYPTGRLCGKAGGTVDGKQLHRFCGCKLCIFSVHIHKKITSEKSEFIRKAVYHQSTGLSRETILDELRL